MNPGDAGLPTAIDWSLPPDFKAGPILWPRPKRIAYGPVVDYGYENEVLLPVDIDVPSTVALGTNVEIISGPEEARLIHLGVEARWPRLGERTLIIDVGGGSAELIISDGGQLVDAVSKPLGAVRLTELFLKNDPPRPVDLQRLHAYIDEKIRPFQVQHGTEKFDRTIVTSATAGALVSAIDQVSRSKRDDMDRQCVRASQVEELYVKLSQLDVAARRKITGIGPRRAEIVVAGSAVFLRALDLFGLKTMCYSVAGVRDGIIADLEGRGVGRERLQLGREQRATVERMAERYHVNVAHAG